MQMRTEQIIGINLVEYQQSIKLSKWPKMLIHKPLITEKLFNFREIEVPC